MPDLTDADLDRLERIAEAATPGPWKWHAEDDSMVMLDQLNVEGDPSVMWCIRCKACSKNPRSDRFSCGWPDPNDAAHIESADPTTTLALLRELRELRQRERKWVEAARPFAEWWKKETDKQMSFDVCWREQQDADGPPVAVFDALAAVLAPIPREECVTRE